MENQENNGKEAVEKNNEEDNNKVGLDYKIQSGREYVVNRQDFNGKTFYSINVRKKNRDDTETFAKKGIRFAGGADIKDKTKIKILSGFEDFYFKKGDKYNAIFSLVITNYEITGQSEEAINQAYDIFNTENKEFELPW